MSTVPLILFSGGLDSTYLVHQAMRHDHVDILYCPGPQGPDKEAAERIAQEKLIKQLEAHSMTRIRNRITGPVMDSTVCVDPFLRQPLSWLFSALMVVDPYKHSEVQIGYILGDQATSVHHEITAAWDNLNKIGKVTSVPLRLPLLRLTKAMIYRELPKAIRDELWHCEVPTQKGRWKKWTPCNECEACKTASRVKFEHMLRYPHEYVSVTVDPPDVSRKDDIVVIDPIKTKRQKRK